MTYSFRENTATNLELMRDRHIVGVLYFYEGSWEYCRYWVAETHIRLNLARHQLKEAKTMAIMIES